MLVRGVAETYYLTQAVFKEGFEGLGAMGRG